MSRPGSAQKDDLNLVSLGRRLRELRGFDLTQREFADELDISQSQLSKYERGLVVPPADVLFFVKKRFKVSIDWLLTGEGSKNSG